MNSLNNKNVFFIGDSIMAQDKKAFDYPDISYNHEKMGQICKAYPTLLEEQLGIRTVKNIAVGGHGIKAQKDILLKENLKATDIAVIGVGVNDFSGSVEIGELPETDNYEYKDTFIGHYCEMMDYIYKQNPRIKAVLMTPLHKDTRHRNVNRHDISSVNERGYRICDYADAIKRIGAFYACPVADMYSKSGLNRFNLPLFTFEGTHPTNEGYEYVIKVLTDALNELY